jgi:hypothetical protein
MPKQNIPLYAFNRGLISKKALARVDLERVGLSAGTMTNWTPRMLGNMAPRVGTEYVNSTDGNNYAVHIPFTFSADDKATIELTDEKLHVEIDEEIVTRVAVSTAVTNGTFNANITSWTDNSETNGVAAWATGGYASLNGDGSDAAILDQAVSVAVGDRNKEHALRVVVERGPVWFSVGATTGDDVYVERTQLDTGEHSLAFTPTGNISIRLLSRNRYVALVDSVTVEAAGVMELPTPWEESDLDRVRYDASLNTIFVACKGLQQRKIERRGLRSWSVALFKPDDGPFLTQNLTATELDASGLSGNITVSSSENFFRSGHVGALFNVYSRNQNVLASLNTEDTYSDPIRVTGVGNGRLWNYIISGTWSGTLTIQRSFDEGLSWGDAVINASITGNGSPTPPGYQDTLDNQIVLYRIGFKLGNYTSGTADIQLQFDAGSIRGVFRVTAYTDAQNVSAEVLKTLGSTAPTSNWSEGAWSDYRGWPSALSLHDGRLWFFGLAKYWASGSDAYESYTDDEEGAASPISRTIGSGPVDDISWAVSLDVLAAGAEAAEKAFGVDALGGKITPENVNAVNISTIGSSPVIPGVIDDSAVFAAQSDVYETSPSDNGTKYGSASLTDLVKECWTASVVRIAVQRQPDTRVHCVLSDGRVAILVYDRAENQQAWWIYETDGEVEDAFVFKRKDGEREDTVYYCVKRTINGSAVRYRERWALESECVGGTACKLLDCHKTYDATPRTSLTGLSHLEGETVYVWAGGKDFGSFTVAGGAVTLPTAAAYATAGLGYTAQWKSTKLAYAAALGTALLQRKRVGQMGVILENAHYQGLKYGRDFDNMDNLPLVVDGAIVAADTVHAEYDHDMTTFNGGWGTDSRLCLESVPNRPVTLLALVMQVETHDKG